MKISKYDNKSGNFIIHTLYQYNNVDTFGGTDPRLGFYTTT